MSRIYHRLLLASRLYYMSRPVRNPSQASLLINLTRLVSLSDQNKLDEVDLGCVQAVDVPRLHGHRRLGGQAQPRRRLRLWHLSRQGATHHCLYTVRIGGGKITRHTFMGMPRILSTKEAGPVPRFMH